MTFALYAYFIIVEFVQKHKKGLQVFLLALFMFILSAGNYNNADYENYYELYNLIEIAPIEAGWTYVTQIFLNNGIPYEVFRTIFFAIFIAVICTALRRYTADRFDVLFLYLVYPFMWDVVQLRNAVVVALLLIAFKYLLIPGWKNDVKYVLLIGIAALFQTTALWYLLYLPAKHIRKKRAMGIAIVVTTVMGCALAYSGFLESAVGYLVSRERTLQYFGSKAHWGILVGWARVAIPLFVFYFFQNWYLQLDDDTGIKVNHIAKRLGGGLCIHQSTIDFHVFGDMLYKVNCVNLLLSILMCFNATFYRIERNVLIFNYIYVLHVISVNDNHSLNRRLKVLLAVICLLFLAGYEYRTNWETVPVSIMMYNILNG